MKELEITCGNCRGTLAVSLQSPERQLQCPLCGTALAVHAFPRFFLEDPTAVLPARVLLTDESSCFFHPQNQATVPCDHCGRFLCALCDIAEGNAHSCPACFSALKAPDTGERPFHVTRFDHVALSLAALPLLFFPLTLFTAPAALYIIFRYRNRPTGIIHPRRKLVFTFASILALLQVGLWIAFLALLLSAYMSGTP